jgi:hypothetical protein
MISNDFLQIQNFVQEISNNLFGNVSPIDSCLQYLDQISFNDLLSSVIKSTETFKSKIKETRSVFLKSPSEDISLLNLIDQVNQCFLDCYSLISKKGQNIPDFLNAFSPEIVNYLKSNE